MWRRQTVDEETPARCEELRRIPARRMVSMALAVAGLWMALSPASAGARESGIQFSPDDKRVFVSKDVGGQRFAITLNTDDGTVTGNVFSPEGGEPKFIFCAPLPPVANRFTCAVADACIASPCDGQFIDVGERTLPADFFTATSLASAAARAATPRDSARIEQGVAAAIASSRESGIQLSPDGRRIFVSKDVSGSRFAITRNNDDHTVTGNVFSFDGGVPKFIICEEAGSEVRVTCAVAYPCSGSPCTEAFVDVGFRNLPPDFFTIPDAIVGASDLSDQITEVLDVGIGVIPQGSALQVEALQACPDGGTVDVNGGVVVYDRCRVGKLVCTGEAPISGNGLSPTALQCHDDARVTDLTLAGSVTPNASGAALNGDLVATRQGQEAFSLVYDGVARSESTFGTPESGKPTVQNHTLFFGGSFTEIEQSFDGSEIILIRKFFPKAGGIIQVLVLELNVTTGKLTPR
jgi:hypothetical protein